MIRRILLYVMVLAVPAFLGFTAWQSARYADLERELFRMEKTQEEWVEANKRLIAGITILSSPDRIERIARDDLGLHKKRPEDVLQISISDLNGGLTADTHSGINGEVYE
ncbi:MAG: septum formation initiator family protein [Spirochaetaceae bacterium]|jgi:cell division protein FtsL|nr:septum formation initiator family protein [Spirochaetaceae bacterium]